MKKLLNLPLFAGVVLLCMSYPASSFALGVDSETAQSSVASPSLDEIFSVAATRFWEELGISISVAELQQGFDDGTVNVNNNGSGVFNIEIDGGNHIISILEDSF